MPITNIGVPREEGSPGRGAELLRPTIEAGGRYEPGEESIAAQAQVRGHGLQLVISRGAVMATPMRHGGEFVNDIKAR